MKTEIKLLALLLALMILFTSCTAGGTAETADTESSSGSKTESTSGSETEEVSYRESISRSLEELETMLTIKDDIWAKAEGELAAFEELALISEDHDAVDALYQVFEDTYYYIATQVSIANIIYYTDMSVTAASDRYQALFEKYGDIYNLYAESCKRVYNSSPIRDELFADWTEEEIREMLSYDPITMELTKENEALLIELNGLPDDTYYDRSAEIYAKLVTNNNRLAELSGYDSYYDYASRDIYGRDYGVEEIETFCTLIKEYYMENFDTISNGWNEKFEALSWGMQNDMIDFLYEPFDKQDENYLEMYIDSFDGSMKEGLGHMLANRNLIFADSENSHHSAFQVYLQDLEIPFCLFGSEGQTTSTLVHEMGHYYASLRNADLTNFDLAETQSQGNEMLLLEFMSGTVKEPLYEALKGYHMYLYAIQTLVSVIVDEFEREVYALESVEGFTSEDFDAIMDKVCARYGGSDFVTENITDMNEYWRTVATNSPVYYISYAVSMTEALNIFAKVSEDRAAGREIYRLLIEEVKEEDKFLGAIQKAGLSSPFEKETFESIISMILN